MALILVHRLLGQKPSSPMSRRLFSPSGLEVILSAHIMPAFHGALSMLFMVPFGYNFFWSSWFVSGFAAIGFVQCAEITFGLVLMLLAEAAGQPKSVGDIKLINAGKILENWKTVSESRVPIGEIPGGPITMHVVVRPQTTEKSEGEACI